jgi:O-antigen biosynthesis protein
MKITAPMAKRWLRKKWRTRYASMRKYILAWMPFKTPKLLLAQRTGDTPDYIFWGVIDWHFRYQRPQQLAKALTKTGRRVFYVSSDFTNDRRAGFSIESLDDSGLLFQIKLFLNTPKVIYFSTPSSAEVSQLQNSIGQLLTWANTHAVISVVQHAFWADVARSIPNSRLMYDCIDHHEGFGNNAKDIVEKETQLLREADVTITTSEWLYSHIAGKTKHRYLIRNATDFDHFSNSPSTLYCGPNNRKIIGYYGAIASWFDCDLISSIAKTFPQCCVVLVGADTVGAQTTLSALQNVVFIGEVSYKNLPHYLHSFDVCLLPFKVLPLTLATNPVKVYEYLSAGKPVVSVDLPEIANFDGLVKIAQSSDEFIAATSDALNTCSTQTEIDQRIAFAKKQTWMHRAADLLTCAESTDNDSAISIIIVTYNNLSYTIDCLDSVMAHTQYQSLEIIVVDNASTDGTKDYLTKWAGNAINRFVILNKDNLGFAAANNQGLALANGEFFILLNNDTFVTPGWARTLCNHLKRDPTIGLIGPVTNNIGNEAKIALEYQSMDEMLAASKKYVNTHINKLTDISTAAFFCVMFSRETYNKVGALDECYGLGFFEDDDYCRRVEQLGRRVVCADDVFVHHQLSASFLKLPSETRRNLFQKNKSIYEKKWGPWQPHKLRSKHH